MGKRTFIEQSKIHWVPAGNEDNVKASIDELKLGCLQRIANASEAAAENNIKLQRDYEYMKTRKEQFEEMYNNLQRRFNAQKGVITKLKKKLP